MVVVDRVEQVLRLMAAALGLQALAVHLAQQILAAVVVVWAAQVAGLQAAEALALSSSAILARSAAQVAR